MAAVPRVADRGTHPYYRDKYGYSPMDFPHSYTIGETVLSLPLTPSMSEDDLQDVIRAVKKVIEAYRR